MKPIFQYIRESSLDPERQAFFMRLIAALPREEKQAIREKLNEEQIPFEEIAKEFDHYKDEPDLSLSIKNLQDNVS